MLLAWPPDCIVYKSSDGVAIRTFPLRYVIVSVLGFGALSIGMVVYSQWLSSRAFEKNSSLIRLTELVQQEVATAHLWFEEALGGDSTIDLERDVHSRLHGGLRLIDARLEDINAQAGAGGHHAEVRDNLMQLRQRIALLDELVKARWRGRESTGVIGGAEDQAFDDLFREILKISGSIGTQVDLLIDADQGKILAINAVILLILAAMFISMAFLIVAGRRAADIRAGKLESLVHERTAKLAAREAEARTRSKELMIARDEANAASEAKSLFLANMSHEIRTPMNGVIGMASLMKRTNLSPVQQQYVETMHSSGLSLLKIINAVLDFSKIEAGKVELEHVDFSVVPLIDDVLNLFTGEAGANNLELRRSIGEKVPVGLVGDPGRLGQVLSNLVSNAIKFSENGCVQLSCERRREFPESTEEVELFFKLRDCGVGIGPVDQERLFEQFSQVDESTTRSHSGTGLGLAISKELVTLMGGEIGVDSEVGVGSTFWFTVRFKVSDASALTATEGAGERTFKCEPGEYEKQAFVKIKDRPAPIPGVSILVVDDNDVNLLVAERMLEELGYSVDLAENGQEAIDACKKHEYAAVLIDCQMPGIDGNQATRAIRIMEGADRHTPIIALTANALEPEKAKAYEAGVDDYLSKPVFLEDLEAALDCLLGNEESAKTSKRVARKVSPSSPDAVLDISLVEELIALGGPDSNFFRNLAGQFRDELPVWIDEIRQSAAAGDVAAVARQAHKLLGLCRQIGVQRLAAVCDELEKLNSDHEAELMDGCLERLRAESNRAVRALSDRYL